MIFDHFRTIPMVRRIDLPWLASWLSLFGLTTSWVCKADTTLVSVGTTGKYLDNGTSQRMAV